MTLERALEALDAGEPATALLSLKQAWKLTRDPIVGELVEVLGRLAHPAGTIAGKTIGAKAAAWLALDEHKTAADLHTLLGGLAIGRWELAVERLRRIAGWQPDPEVASALVALVDAAPYPAQQTLELWDLVLATLVGIADPRTQAHLERLAQRKWPGSARMDKLMKQRLRDAASALAKLPPARLDADQTATRDRLVRRLLKPATPGHKSELELLAEIYERPDDDELRKVYGDLLLERGDPRGELIALQYQPERDLKREAAILRKHQKVWLGPLAAVADAATFERGFVATFAYAARYASQLATLAGAREWATVRALRFVEAKTRNGIVEFLTNPVMRSLRDIRGIGPGHVIELAERVVEIHALGFDVPNEAPIEDLHLEEFPKLHELEVTSRAYRLAPLEWLQQSPALARLDVLEVQNGDAAFPSWLAAVQERAPELRKLVVRPTADSASGGVTFTLVRGASSKLDALTMVPAVPSVPTHVTEPYERYAFDAMSAALRALPTGRIATLVVEETPILAAHAAPLAEVLGQTRARLGI
jgi:uncharacterized protein (TIGR02996 family)